MTYIISSKSDANHFLFLEIAQYKENSLRIDPKTKRKFYIPKDEEDVIIPPELRLLLEGHEIRDRLIHAIREFESIDTRPPSFLYTISRR